MRTNDTGRPGRFLVIEGPDGSGKSSVVEEVKRHLAVRGADALFVRDPGGTAVGAEIRKVLLDARHEGMCPMTELLLYVASRAQLVSEAIRPALNAGRLVVADRYYLSTLVYQGVAGALPEGELKRVVMLGLEGALPDHWILLDVDAETGLARVGGNSDRMEQKGVLFHEQVRQHYLGYADGAPDGSVTVVDASRSRLEVTKDALEAVDAFLS